MRIEIDIDKVLDAETARVLSEELKRLEDESQEREALLAFAFLRSFREALEKFSGGDIMAMEEFARWWKEQRKRAIIFFGEIIIINVVAILGLGYIFVKFLGLIPTFIAIISGAVLAGSLHYFASRNDSNEEILKKVKKVVERYFT